MPTSIRRLPVMAVIVLSIGYVVVAGLTAVSAAVRPNHHPRSRRKRHR